MDEMFTAPGVIERQTADLAEQCALLDAEISDIDNKLKRRKNELQKAKESLADLLIQAGLDSVKCSNGLHPQLSLKRRFFRQAGIGKDQVIVWLRQVGLGDIVKETVHFGTLQSTLSAYEEGNHKIPESLFTISTEKSIRLGGKSKFVSERVKAATSAV